ncbi:hybrid sensor histidine kinase/response regulator [Myxococcus xanthus]|uniref:histidine kinase n=1 Tax=Myxococcus xanthus TaxID=34 RepID=A0AAE6KSI3_MYXXA|nr:ATP-binding protein [Myxococcus xanthus]QDE68214.1 hybrid sensor histidine kinase/response regulator [Myxococcus xanthus]QDE75491.1 hybrid sensor histidine kinase/response regulator [Myxococcus xanthus]
MKPRSLRFYLGLLALGLLVPLVLFAAGAVNRFAASQREARAQGMRETARALALVVERELGQSVRALEVLSHSAPLAQGDLKTFHATCQAVVESQAQWGSLVLLDVEGRTMFTTDQPFGTDLAALVDERHFVREVVKTGRAVISDFPYQRFQGPPTVVVAMPVRRQGVLAGVLVATYAMQHFDKLWDEQRIQGDWVGTLVDEEGVILSRSRGRARFVGTKARPEYIENIRVGREGFFASQTVDGMKSFAAYARLQLVPWTVSFSGPREVFTASVNQSLVALLIAGLGCCVIATAWAAWVSRRMTRPLRALARAARERPDSADAFTNVGPTGISELEDLRATLALTAAMVMEREGALRTKMTEAEAANLAKDQFLAMLGHELRNPLSAITSGVKVLSVTEDAASRERARALVERQAFHLARLVDDLLDVERVSSGRILLQKQTMDLSECVRRAVAALESSGRTQAHQVEVEAPRAWLEGDASRLEQVVTNLVSNALKYTPPGGRIRVVTREEPGHVVLEVSDTGDGLSPELQERVFELFFQAERTLDRAQGGLGIGLTLVKRLVELHGGSVRAQSDGLAKGSTFTVRLPRGQVEQAPRLQDAPMAPASGRHVLLVDDHTDSRQLVRELLELEGHTVSEAEDGPSGLARARELRPEVVLLDIGLPGLDGYEVARALRSTDEGRDLLLIAVTGYGLEEDRRRALEAGFDEHLVKPVDLTRLRELLRPRKRAAPAHST